MEARVCWALLFNLLNKRAGFGLEKCNWAQAWVGMSPAQTGPIYLFAYSVLFWVHNHVISEVYLPPFFLEGVHVQIVWQQKNIKILIQCKMVKYKELMLVN